MRINLDSTERQPNEIVGLEAGFIYDVIPVNGTSEIFRQILSIKCKCPS
jgi:hypothetical protein